MPRVVTGELLARDTKFAIVVSRFNELITRSLLSGALETLRRHGGVDDQTTIVWTPGAFELVLAADELARSGQYDAICCLGAVIQGETTHHEYINHQVAAGIMRINQETRVPVTFGVLTCGNMDQAFARAGGKAGNKGAEAVLAAIEMVNVLRQLRGES